MTFSTFQGNSSIKAVTRNAVTVRIVYGKETNTVAIQRNLHSSSAQVNEGINDTFRATTCTNSTHEIGGFGGFCG